MKWFESIFLRTRLNARVILRSTAVCVSTVYVIFGYLNFFDVSETIFNWLKNKFEIFNTCKIAKPLASLIILTIVFAVFFVISLICVLCIEKKKVCAVKGGHGLYKMYGNIFDIKGEENDDGSLKRVSVAIAVNRFFDTIVDDNLIASSTLHGMWIKKMLNDGMTLPEIDNEISKSLKKQKNLTQPIKRQDKRAGKKYFYEPGTIAEVVDKNNVNYFLLGLTDFDSITLHNKVTRKEYLNALQSLAEFIVERSQGRPVYVSIMGAGITGLVEDKQTALDLIVDVLKLNKDSLNCDVYVVAYSGDKNTVKIL